MSRGFGSLQRQVLDALLDRRDNDVYNAADVIELANPNVTPLVRARWRWYTVDLLDLVELDAPRPQRVSLHRAIRSLHQADQLEIAMACPYPTILGGERSPGQRWGGLYVPKLNYYPDHMMSFYVDARWPYTQGRRLWFRLPPPTKREDIPGDDQIAFVDYLHTGNPKPFQEFTLKLRRFRDEEEAWTSPVGRFVRWLLCGPTASATQML